jgi:hypothetical protein
MKYAVILFIGICALAPSISPVGALVAQARQSAQSTARPGPVRTEGGVVADAAGQFNALGATLFWGAWGYKFERARLERNLATLNAAGIDYVRVLGSVGGASWADRQTDPGWDDYDAIIAGVTDLVYDRFGMRVQWTLFGGAPFTPAGAARVSLVDRFARMAQGREHKIFAFEIANEASNNGFGGAEGIAELRRLGKRLNDLTSVLVALSSPSSRGACETYAGSGVDVMTMHYARGFGKEGPVRALRQPWNYSRASDAKCSGALPAVVFNNEPIGPESSVQEDDSPSRIAAAYVMTFLAGNASYVLHTGPGIRGGGAADLSRKPPRHANFDELPSFKAITAALAAAERYLPAGLANWTRRSSKSAAAPLFGHDGLYFASSGSQFVALVIGVGKTTSIRARRSASLEIRNLATGKVIMHLKVIPGEDIPLTGGEELVIIGRST